jgi:hypothetical protein
MDAIYLLILLILFFGTIGLVVALDRMEDGP